jgi:hypothetical protein
MMVKNLRGNPCGLKGKCMNIIQQKTGTGTVASAATQFAHA